MSISSSTSIKKQNSNIRYTTDTKELEYCLALANSYCSSDRCFSPISIFTQCNNSSFNSFVYFNQFPRFNLQMIEKYLSYKSTMCSTSVFEPFFSLEFLYIILLKLQINRMVNKKNWLS